MSFGALVLRLADGKLHAIPFDDDNALMSEARIVRDAGQIKIGKDVQLVKSGIALSDGTFNGSLMEFSAKQRKAK
jgi:hypothetical protein